jgi:two-component system capsular synthesis sensor histidine kinase RcsC
MRALVADDDANNREIVRRLLARLGTACDEARSGDEAVASARAAAASGHPYDLLFLDLSMPGLDGFAAARLLKAEGLPSRLVALSGHDDDPAIAEAGFDGFIQKPLTIEALHRFAG